MKKLALDLGDASLGIAISDAHGMLARGLENARFASGDYAAMTERVSEVLADEPVDEIILGYPRNMDGTRGEQAEKVEAFKALLETRVDVTITLYDERLTTRMAASRMREAGRSRKKRQRTLDQEAAVVLLQDYLDKERDDGGR